MNCDYGKNNPLQATVDHVIPLSQGGSSGTKNTVLACRHCNSLKGSLSEEEFRHCMTLSSFPKDIKKIYPLSNVRVSKAERKRKREAERIKNNPITEASMPKCLLWEH